MFSWENPDDRVAIVQMNAELRHAQLELLSAQCATHRLRLRFTNEDVARYAQRDTLRKAIDAANGLHEYYSSISAQIPRSEEPGVAPTLGSDKLAEGIHLMQAYLQKQRDHYFPVGKSLDTRYRVALHPFFAPQFLEQVRIVELQGQRLPTPSFFTEARALGFVNLPELSSMPSLTFIDVIVFNDRISEQALFHGLVHAVQFKILGAERYTEALVRGFFKTHSHLSVPLEAHAFTLDSRFASNRDESFSVEEKVRMWVREGRY